MEYEEDKCIKIILPARDIPIGSTVTKKTGQKEYILQDKFIFHGEGGEKITPCKGMLYLVSSESVNIIKDDQELMWPTNIYELEYFIESLKCHK